MGRLRAQKGKFMERLIIGQFEQVGWCVASVQEEFKDADINVLDLGVMTKEEAWEKAWELNRECGNHDQIYIAVCKINLEAGEIQQPGEWLKIPKFVGNGAERHIVDDYKCSKCGYVWDERERRCPNCHSEMRWENG